MADALISRRGGGGAMIKFENYNSSFKSKTAPNLSSARYNLAATKVGSYALFGGGDNSGYSSTVDAYNAALIRSTATPLSTARVSLAATAIGNYALFGGGRDADNLSTVEAYNSSLARNTQAVLSQGRCMLAATTIGNYAFFGGGNSNSIYSSIVDAVYGSVDLILYKNSKYKFQNMIEEETVTADMETISIPTPATGYIKFKNTTI